MKKSEEKKDRPSGKNVPPAKSAAGGPGAPKALVMDDEEAVRKVTCVMLRLLGYEAAAAADAREAAAMVKTARENGRPYDVLILDLTVAGGLGGTTAIRLIRPIDPAVPAIASSGYAGEYTDANLTADGFNVFLAKPFHMEDLKAALESARPPT